MPFTGSDICKVRIFRSAALSPRLLSPFRSCASSLPLFYFLLSTFYASISFAIFIPPLGVFLERGCHADFVCSSFLLQTMRNSRRVQFINILLVCISSLGSHRILKNLYPHPPVDDLGLHVCVHLYHPLPSLTYF